MVGKLVFAINGERFELSKVEPSTTLLEFLRTQTRFAGSKLGCGEGGCGACVVHVATYDPENDQVKEFNVSSCLTLLCSLNFCSVTTTEGLGNIKDGLHSVQQRFAGFHASQCGFCTPGMCMSLFSALTNADKTCRPEPPTGFSKITKLEAEKSISSNLCRCTGYRSIADACKSFAENVDIEDLGLNTFWKQGEDANVDKLPFYRPGEICTFPEFLKYEMKCSIDISRNYRHTSLLDCRWYRPSSFEELYELLDSTEFIESRVKLVVGNTSSGVYKEYVLHDKYIDLKGIPELSLIERNDRGIAFGAAVTISTAIEELKKNEGKTKSSETSVFSKLADHMGRVASPFVRNLASLGGNLILAQRKEFPSDIATILLGAGSTVCLQMPLERLTLSLEEFLERPPCDERTILVSIFIPSWDAEPEKFSGPTSDSSVLFETYRAAPRPLGNALAYLNCAFLGHVLVDKNSGYLVFLDLILAFGAYGVEHAIRAREVEDFLIGKVLTSSVLLEAIQLLRRTIRPKEGTSYPRYRSSLAVSYLFQFLQPLAKGLTAPEKTVHLDVPSITVCPERNNDGCTDILPSSASEWEKLDCPDSILSSKQIVEFSREYLPVGAPIKKVLVEVQTSGEAIYVDDIPIPKDCLHGSFIYSTKPLAYVEGIKLISTTSCQKPLVYIGANDIPKGGQNIGSSFIYGSEALFADSLTECTGQAIGVVIAETQKYADMAAKLADVQYSTKNLEPPILTVEEAVERSSFFDTPPDLTPQIVGDISKGMAEADYKISDEVKLNSQYFFYMETQSALAIPDEDNCIVVYSACQSPETTQNTIAKCLGIPDHNVRVITRRSGGAFGGKTIRSVPVATACALSAFVLRRPVRMYLDRTTDIIMSGGRHPMKINYTVGFKSDGKITGLHLDILINAGLTIDVSVIIPDNVISSLKKYNWGALSFDIKLCKTNVASKSSMRGPGEVQGSYIAEAVIERVASFLSMNANVVRMKNLHTYDSLAFFYGIAAGDASEYTLPSIVDELISAASYLDRLEAIQHFNNCHIWRKRGISWLPCVFQAKQRPAPGRVSILDDGSVVVEVGGIEQGQGLWTKVKQVTAFALEELWDDGSEHLLDRVRIIQADTLSLIQGGYTVGSTTSESNCGAVRQSCSILVDRLRSLKESLETQMGSVSWDTLTMQATSQSVNLSASTYWVPGNTTYTYLNYGAAMSEVEIDVLTGATTILRTDLIFDCGQTLSAAVDLGQIEGGFVQGIGFFVDEEYVINEDGMVISDSTWTYKIPSIDTIPRQFNVKVLNTGHNEKRVLSSKAAGEPPLFLSASVHCAIREAIRAARMENFSSAAETAYTDDSSFFQLQVPAIMPAVKELCGFDIVEKYLENLASPTLHVEA